MEILYIHDYQPEISVLGPGKRFVLWVQGCNFSCPECIAPHTHDFGKSNFQMSVKEVYELILTSRSIEGVTFSGGEPMEQAIALAELSIMLKEKTSLSIMCYTGYKIEELRQPAQTEFLKYIDILVDGRYVDHLNLGQVWKGSSNQKIHFLTDRYKHLETSLDSIQSGLEFLIQENTLRVIGIPGREELKTLSERMALRGVKLEF